MENRWKTDVLEILEVLVFAFLVAFGRRHFSYMCAVKNSALHWQSFTHPSTFHSPKTYPTMSTSPLEILVQYCGGWGYKRFFVSLKEALEKEFPGKVAIVAIPDTSSTGNFEVTLVKTGQLVHSKRNGGGKCDVGSEERAALFSLIRSMVA